tara:strand:+ start:56998 stop:57243 length:246 start_codon:yes stop_codon:yes gene_type:complete
LALVNEKDRLAAVLICIFTNTPKNKSGGRRFAPTCHEKAVALSQHQVTVQAFVLHLLAQAINKKRCLLQLRPLFAHSAKTV